MADKLTVSAIRALYDSIDEANLTLPLAEEVDFETKWYMIELLRRDLLGITVAEDAGDGDDLADQIAALKTLIETQLSYDQAGFYVGKPTGNLKLFSIETRRAFTLPANCLGSGASVGTVPHATAVFPIKKNGLLIGTFIFPAGVSTASFSSTATAFVAGDILEVHAPATADDDLTDVRFTFKINLEI
jgi:hypothetical protein